MWRLKKKGVRRGRATGLADFEMTAQVARNQSLLGLMKNGKCWGGRHTQASNKSHGASNHTIPSSPDVRLELLVLHACIHQYNMHVGRKIR